MKFKWDHRAATSDPKTKALFILLPSVSGLGCRRQSVAAFDSSAMAIRNLTTARAYFCIFPWRLVIRSGFDDFRHVITSFQE